MNEFDLNIGADVFSTEGPCGTLARIVIDPQTWHVTHLVVEEGILTKRAWVFPFSSVERATTAEVLLLIPPDELENYPVYQEETVEVAEARERDGTQPEDWREGAPLGMGPVAPLPSIQETVHHGVPQDSVVMRRGMAVEGLDRGVGKVDFLQVDAATGKITEIVVQKGVLFTTRRAIPAALASTISEDGIFVEALEDALKELPEYRSEDEE